MPERAVVDRHSVPVAYYCRFHVVVAGKVVLMFVWLLYWDDTWTEQLTFVDCCYTVESSLQKPRNIL